jgi:hypothetical protein
MALGKLLVGRFEWSPGPICWVSAGGQAGTYSKLLMVNSYSSWGYPTGPEGTHALGYWLQVCPFLTITNSKCPRAAVEPMVGHLRTPGP